MLTLPSGGFLMVIFSPAFTPRYSGSDLLKVNCPLAVSIISIIAFPC